MVVHNNAATVFSYLYGWGPLFVISTLVFYPKTFTNKLILLNIFFFFLYALILPNILWTEMSDSYSFRQVTNFSTITVAVTLFVWLGKNSNPRMWNKLGKLGLIFIIITCVMTIIAATINPYIVRASYSSGKEAINNFMFFRKLGVGSYGFMTSITLLFPTLIYLYKQKKLQRLNRVKHLGVIIIIYYTLLQAQIFANILIATFTIIISTLVINKKMNINTPQIIFLMILFVIIPNSNLTGLFGMLANSFDTGSILHEKLIDFASLFAPKIDISNTEMGYRLERFPMLWLAFVASPIFGDASYNSRYAYELSKGAHLFWMSRLALWGIVGFVPFIWLLYRNFKEIYFFFSSEFRFYYLLSVLSFVALGLIKYVNFIESFLVLFVIIPGLYLVTVNNNSMKPIREKNYKSHSAKF